MSHILRTKPSVAAVFRMLPATIKTIVLESKLNDGTVRDAVTLLMAAKLAYCAGYDQCRPIIAAGDKPNVVRPGRYEVIRAAAKRRIESGKDRTEYQRAYRERTKEKRAAYIKAHADHRREQRQKLAAAKKAIDATVFAVETPKTVWR